MQRVQITVLLGVRFFQFPHYIRSLGSMCSVHCYVPIYTQFVFCPRTERPLFHPYKTTGNILISCFEEETDGDGVRVSGKNACMECRYNLLM